MNWLKERLRAALDWLGLEVHGKAALRLSYERELRERELRAWSVLARVPFRQNLDVGANEGQFAAYACRLWPDAREASRIQIRVERLDDWAAEHGGVQQPLLVKIDVQGFEDQVIDGELSTILKAQWLAVEVSFHELYENQSLFDDIYRLLARHGFRYRGNVQQFLNRAGDRVLFADALFENSRACTL